MEKFHFHSFYYKYIPYKIACQVLFVLLSKSNHCRHKVPYNLFFFRLKITAFKVKR